MLAFFAAIFGPIVGGAVGLIGHALGDALFYGSVWWSWVFPEAVFGILVGLFARFYKVRKGSFGAKQIAIFNIVQAIANVIAWVLAASALDIAIYAEPANKVFVQGATSCILNIVIIAILGTLLLAAYSRVGAKTGSLSKED
ncbi:MAG: ECF-type riboflavin transporter substrate-binding protein [Clostridiales bacterium]|nr:ECF-type riboflavin transporter substrate-binding protein [Clostridiales bacterium]